MYNIGNYSEKRLVMKIEVITVGPIDVNCVILYCDEHLSAIVIDPGDSAARIIKFMEERKLIPKLVLNTHCHSDHTGGVEAVARHFSIPFLCHEDDAWMLTSKEQQDIADYLGVKKAPKNDATVSDGEIIDLCEDFSIRIIHTPGHTPGGICIYGDGFLISGDTLFLNSIGRSDLTGGNHMQLLASIKEKLFILPDDTIVFPGHGETTTIGEEKEHNPFLRQLEGYA